MTIGFLFFNVKNIDNIIFKVYYIPYPHRGDMEVLLWNNMNIQRLFLTE